MPDERLLVIGRGPEEERLRGLLPQNAEIVSDVSDAQLRWAYAHCAALIAPAIEDFGLTPLEVGAFGKPTLALRGGGYLDTVADGVSGHFFDRPEAADIAAAVRRSRAHRLGRRGHPGARPPLRRGALPVDHRRGRRSPGLSLTRRPARSPRAPGIADRGGQPARVALASFGPGHPRGVQSVAHVAELDHDGRHVGEVQGAEVAAYVECVTAGDVRRPGQAARPAAPPRVASASRRDDR